VPRALPGDDHAHGQDEDKREESALSPHRRLQKRSIRTEWAKPAFTTARRQRAAA
jgi:hypothetical protein